MVSCMITNKKCDIVERGDIVIHTERTGNSLENFIKRAYQISVKDVLHHKVVTWEHQGYQQGPEK